MSLVEKVLTTQIDQTEREKLLKMCQRLRGLSGQHGEILYQDGFGFFVSNDSGVPEIICSLREAFSDVPAGVGLIIGSGGIFSLLPEMETIKAVIIIDEDSMVLEFNKFLKKQILSGKSVNEILFAISHSMFSAIDWTNHRPPIEDLVLEKKKYGDFHWTNEERLEKVRSALEKIPIVFIGADIRDKNFISRLKDVFNQYDLGISFANLTNVHDWILGSPFNGRFFDDTMDYLSVLPWFPNTPIMSSKKILLKATLSIGFKSYVEETSSK